MGGTCSMNGEMKNIHKILVDEPKENRPLARPIFILK
jgi:hypothetical protein